MAIILEKIVTNLKNHKIMKKIIILVCGTFLLLSCAKENNLKDYPIIPKPNKLLMKRGVFPVNAKTKITAEDGLDFEAQLLGEMLEKASGEDIEVGEAGNVKLSIDESITNKEGYVLGISSDEVIVKAKTAAGIFYAIQTIRQLLPAQTEIRSIGNLYLPNATISDAPRYPYRGMHLDVCRHFFPVKFIKKYIDLIAMHKMNTFHWHLTEDQGWRIEIKKYPKLMEIASKRPETIIGKNFNPYKGDGKPYGGYYTQEQIKEIVAYAMQRHINVIPEIELPGHSVAALAAYPDLGNTDIKPYYDKKKKKTLYKYNKSNKRTYKVRTKWGVSNEIYAPKEATFEFLQDIFDEVISLFPSPLIHIGGDEAPKTEWNASKFAQGVIKKNKLKDSHELQSYFIKRIEKYLNSKGKNIIGWDEILEGGLAPNAAVMSWRGIQGGIEAAKQHHNVVMTPGSHCYFDHYQVPAEEHKNEPLAICCYTSVEKVYSYEPTPKELNEEEQKYIQGAQGNVWTEYIKTPKHVEYMILPRMTALSEVVWSSKENKNWADFRVRLEAMKLRYEALKLNYANHVFRKQEQEKKANKKEK